MALKLKGSTSGFVAIDCAAEGGNNTLILPSDNGVAGAIWANNVDTAGVATCTSITINKNGDLTVPGTVSVGGTITYEDVTNVDSVGVITARSGVVVTGVTTTTQFKVTTGANAFETSANVFKGTAGQKGVYLRSALSAEGTPSYSSVDDTNTGMFLPGSDVCAFTTGGSERLRIDSSGNTGIGTVSPQEKLHLYGGNCALEVDAAANRYCSVGFSVDGASKWWMGRGDSDVLLETSFFIGKDGGSAVDKGGNSAKFVIDTNGNIGIGVTNPGNALEIYGTAASVVAEVNGTGRYRGYEIHEAGTRKAYFQHDATDNCALLNTAEAELKFYTSDTQVMELDGTGRLLVGGHTTASIVNAGGIESLNATGANFGVGRFVASAVGPDIVLVKSRNATLGSHTVVQDDDLVGTVKFRGSDGGEWVDTARIASYVDGTPGDDDMPGRLVFSTTADGASSVTERLSITSSGISKFQNFGGGQIWLGGDSAHTAKVTITDNGGTGNGNFILAGPSGDHLKITSGGVVLIADAATAANTPMETFGSAALQIATTAGGSIVLGRNDTSTTTDNNIGGIYWDTNDSSGNAWNDVARISCTADGSHNDGDYPTRLTFHVTDDGAGAVSERMRIRSNGVVLIGRSTQPNDINKLVVTGTSPADNYDSTLYLEGSETTGAINTGGAIGFGGHDGGTARNWGNIWCMKENGNANDRASYMSFHTRVVGGNILEKMRISSTGIVNIANNIPTPTVTGSGQLNVYTSASGGICQFVHDAGTGGLRLAGTGNGSGANLLFSNDYNSGTFSDHWCFSHNGANDNLYLRTGGVSATNGYFFTPNCDFHLKSTQAANVEPGASITFEQVNNDNQADCYRINFWEGEAGDRTNGNAHISLRYNGSTSDGGNGAFRICNENATRIFYVNRLGNGGISGSFSKGSGSFQIDHPLDSKKDTHYLRHSFVEGPQADNIYRGVVTLSSGTATINLDTASGMTEGTFVLLNTNVQCFTSNESDWTAIKGSVSGNTLTITAQDNSSTASISWLVIGERQDDHVKNNTDMFDSNGKLIVEPLKVISSSSSD